MSSTPHMEDIITAVRDLPGVFVVAPVEGSDFPELVWGDSFFYYAPDGRMPRNAQPYATVVTKNYPGDIASDLDPPDRRRVNVHVDRETFRQLVGEEPRGGSRTRDGEEVRGAARTWDHAATDTVTPHPVYGALGWISVVNPGSSTTETLVRVLRLAHEAARLRAERRG